MSDAIRDRVDSDLGACVSLLRAVHEVDGYPLNWPADPRGWLAPPEALGAWVAVTGDGTVAGHVAVHRAGSEMDAELSRLFVGPAARRRSLAGGLVRVAREWAFHRGYALTLNVTATGDRAAAVAFYEATGWRYTHTTVADWAGPDGGPVRLRHYSADGR